MAVPKQKISKSKRGMRRSNSKGKLKKINLIENSMGNLSLPHHISPEGDYNDKQVVEE